jgi:uncharacterized YigZ family protein
MSNDSRYLIPAGRHRVELEVQRSRFLTTVEPVASAEEARAFVARVSAEFPDANHHCWAFAVGPPGSTASVGMSDDGEPHGTAGRPMLTALLHGGVGDIAAVVTRWFGGELLGKGGLVRAYTGGVQQALAQLPTREKVRKVELTFVLDYASVAGVRRLLPAHEATALVEDYAEAVRYRVELPASRVDALRTALRDLTHGGVRWLEPD